MRPTILIVEDEPEIRRFLRFSLGAEGYRVVESSTGRRGTIDAGTHKPDVAIVDLGLPDVDGVEVVRHIREWSPMPIIILSARSQERTKIEAFGAGADDYVTKPFGISELLARIRVALRHARARRMPDEPVLEIGPIRIDQARHEVHVDGRDVHLTPTEYRLLVLLARHVGKVLTHRQLLNEVWGPRSTHQTHYLRVHMAALRRKVEADPARPRWLTTEPGVGYRMLDPR